MGVQGRRGRARKSPSCTPRSAAPANSGGGRGIAGVRNKSKEYARMAPMGGGFNIIFLDECDHLTGDAQAALRRTMEMFTRTSRFVLSAKYSSRPLPPA